MLWGLVILALGILWTLDNLGQIDASRVVQWWPLVTLGWGITLLRRARGGSFPLAGWIWTIIGAVSMLRPLGIARIDVFDLWPMIFILIGATVVVRAWRGVAESGPVTAGPRFDASAFLAGAQRKVVTQEFSACDVNSVFAGTTLDFRPARLANGRGVVEVYAMFGGIELIVPPEWRVVSEVTPILGVFQDLSVVPEDPAAPTLVIRGHAVMGGIEVRNDEVRGTGARTRSHVVRVGVAD